MLYWAKVMDTQSGDRESGMEGAQLNGVERKQRSQAEKDGHEKKWQFVRRLFVFIGKSALCGKVKYNHKGYLDNLFNLFSWYSQPTFEVFEIRITEKNNIFCLFAFTTKIM